MKLTIDELLKLLPDFKIDRRRKNIIGQCPKCGHNEFGISLEENHKFGCYRLQKCGFKGNIFSLLKFLGKVDDVYEKKAKIIPDKINTLDDQLIIDDLYNKPLSMPIGWKRVYQDDYLDSRGFTSRDYQTYPVGVTNLRARFKGFVLFQILEDDVVVGFVGRNKKTKQQIDQLNDDYKQRGLSQVELRYDNSLSDFERIVYGLDELNKNTKVIIIVEGIFDKINVDRQLNLSHQDEVKCVATFKANISYTQMKKIDIKAPNINKVILLYDPDVVKLIKENIQSLKKIWSDVTVGYGGDKDPGDMSYEELSKTFDNLYQPLHFHTNILEVNKIS